MAYKEPLTDKAFQDLNEQMENEELIIKLADFFAVFGDSTRMQILMLLRISEMNVSDIAQTLNMSTSAISHQLKVLRQNDLVRTRRDGKYIYYYLSDAHVISIITQGVEHLLEDKFAINEE